MDFNPQQLELWQAAIDERPTYHSGGTILRFEEPVEHRSRQRSLFARRLRLDEFAVRARAQDRKLRELGLL
jgi:hypothetical protein